VSVIHSLTSGQQLDLLYEVRLCSMMVGCSILQVQS
jgi:hypothetical protein